LDLSVTLETLLDQKCVRIIRFRTVEELVHNKSTAGPLSGGGGKGGVFAVTATVFAKQPRHPGRADALIGKRKKKVPATTDTI